MCALLAACSWSVDKDQMLASGPEGPTPRWEFRDLKIKDTNDLIKKIEYGDLPDKIMLNIHPQRWTNDYVPWVKELVVQNFKNVFKKWLIRIK